MPNILRDTVIIVCDASEVADGQWRARAIIIWPDGSCDVGAANLDGATKAEAEARAGKKAEERWNLIQNHGTLNKTHPQPGAILKLPLP